MLRYGHDNCHGKSASERYGYAKSGHRVRRTKQHHHCYGWRHLSVEYRCYNGIHYSNTFNYNYIYRYSNGRKWLYQIRYGYSNRQPTSECYGYGFSGYYLCRPKQHSHGYRRRHLPVEHRRYKRCHHGEPCCDYYLYGYSNRCKWLYQNGYCNGDGESASNSYCYAKSGYDL